MAARKIINIYKAKKDIKGVLPTGENDENYEKLNTVSNNITKAKNVLYDDNHNLEATNVQNAIDKLQSNKNIISNGNEYFSGRYLLNTDNGKKPIYYRVWNKQILSPSIDYMEIDLSSFFDSVDIWFPTQNILANPNSYFSFNTVNVNSASGSEIYIDYLRKRIITYRAENRDQIYNIYIDYTKNTDSWEY